MTKLQYKLEVYEGPLDMLLTLIAKNKLNIYDIPIAELLDQYMEQIEIMRRESMDVASEFLEMAARLVHIKSLSLLPKHDEEDELRAELTGQLVEYQQCKEAATKIGEVFTFDRLIRETQELSVETEYKGKHTPEELMSALQIAIGKGKSLLPPKAESFSGIVSKKIVSVTSQIVSVLKSLWKKKKMPFKSLFAEKKDKSERVAAFLAVLELVKGERIRVEGDGDNAEVVLIKGGEKP